MYSSDPTASASDRQHLPFKEVFVHGDCYVQPNVRHPFFNPQLQQDVLQLDCLTTIAIQVYYFCENIPARSWRLVPKASNDFISKSIETDGSPTSIFATRD